MMLGLLAVAAGSASPAAVLRKPVSERARPKAESMLDKIDRLAKPRLANPHSTAEFSALSSVGGSPKQRKKTSLAELKKILRENQTDSVVESSKSTDKHASVISQSLGVNKLATLDDIFRTDKGESRALPPATKQGRKKAEARGLDDSEFSEDGSEESGEADEAEEIESALPSESSADESLYADEHEVKGHEGEGEEESEAAESAFHIQDLEKVSELVTKIKEDVKSKILGDLQNEMMIKQLEVSYEVYESINEVRKKYFFFKDSLEQSVQLLKDMVDFLEQFVTDSTEDHAIQDALARKGIEVDEHNHKLLLGLLLKLQQLVDKFHEEIFDSFNDYFKELNAIHFNEDISDAEKVRKMIQIASELSIFENGVIDDQSKQIMEVARLSLDNPRYDHLAKAFEREFVPPGQGLEAAKLSREGAAKTLGVALLGLAYLLVLG